MGMANGQDLSSILLCTCFAALRDLLRLHGSPLTAASCLACLQPTSRGAGRLSVRSCSLHTTARYRLKL